MASPTRTATCISLMAALLVVGILQDVGTLAAHDVVDAANAANATSTHGGGKCQSLHCMAKGTYAMDSKIVRKFARAMQAVVIIAALSLVAWYAQRARANTATVAPGVAQARAELEREEAAGLVVEAEDEDEVLEDEEYALDKPSTSMPSPHLPPARSSSPPPQLPLQSPQLPQTRVAPEKLSEAPNATSSMEVDDMPSSAEGDQIASGLSNEAARAPPALAPTFANLQSSATDAAAMAEAALAHARSLMQRGDDSEITPTLPQAKALKLAEDID